MGLKKIFLICVVLALLAGSVCAVCASNGVNDFKVDKSYSNAYSGSYYSLYLNKQNDAGVAIFKNVDDDVYDDADGDDVYDHLIHNDGREYLHADDDYKLNKNSDNTGTFTDYDNGEHGIAELVKSGGTEYIVVFWAKNNSNLKDSDLSSQLSQFNKDNNVQPIAF